MQADLADTLACRTVWLHLHDPVARERVDELIRQQQLQWQTEMALRELERWRRHKDLSDRGKMKPRISIITLGVSDLDQAIRFYEEGLGLPRKSIESDGIA